MPAPIRHYFPEQMRNAVANSEKENKNLCSTSMGGHPNCLSGFWSLSWLQSLLGNHCQGCYQKQTSRASHPHRCALANLKVYHYLLFSSSHQSSTSGCSPAFPLGSLDAIFLTAYRNAAGVSLRPGNWLQKQLTYLDDWIWPGRVSLPLLWETDI